MSLTPAQILGIIKLVRDIITPEVWQKILRYFAEWNQMPSEEKILEMHGDIHPPDWYDRTTLHGMQPPAEPKFKPFMTYYIENDWNGLLKPAVRTCCNFWNRFLYPEKTTVLRVGHFTEDSFTIARCWYPYTLPWATFSRIEYNTKYLSPDESIEGTMTHEAGHSLGMGFGEKWFNLFDDRNGKFYSEIITLLPDLELMRVELDGGSGTELSHWEEASLISERDLMSGWKSENEIVLPITIAVFSLMGCTIRERLISIALLDSLLQEARQVLVPSNLKTVAREMKLDHFEPTDLMEEIIK